MLAVYNPSHPDAVSGWVALTADAPWPAGASVIHVRDTALVVTGTTPNGVATTATITLPYRMYDMHFGADGGSGTLTAGEGRVLWIPKGTAAAAASCPQFANDITSSAEAVSANISKTADENKVGTVLNPPESHVVRFTGVTGTSAPGTISFVAEYHIY